jgi:aspartate/methionine/tyrosine aminotransferase
MGKKYQMVFWAQYGNAYGDPKSMPLDEIKLDYKVSNREDLDAFYAYVPEFTVTQDFSKNITLKRPFAQLNFATEVGDMDESIAAGDLGIHNKAAVTIKNVANTLDLFTGKTFYVDGDGAVKATGVEVVVPDLYWDNYALVFEESAGAKLSLFNTFKDGHFDTAAMKKALLAGEGKKILILNFPNNPTGYTATIEDAVKIVAAVKAAAKAGKKIVVVLDDAYFGLVYEKGVHEESLFAEFATLSPNVLAVKLDGTTKEDYVWGLRVGFISFAFKGATDAQLKALEAKAAGNVRSAVSNITSIGQQLSIEAFADKGYAAQKKAKYAVLKSRYQEIRRILKKNAKYAESFEVMPFNSGYFMCVKPIGVEAEAVRKRLIEGYSTGTIVLSGLIRLAFATVPLKNLAQLFDAVDSAIRDLKGLKR